MKSWLKSELVRDGMDLYAAEDIVNKVKWPTEKPPAHMSIDDRGFQFNGEFPEMSDILNFKPWNKRNG
jgi:hypothetical protein